jgi:hypothetical protein
MLRFKNGDKARVRKIDGQGEFEGLVVTIIDAGTWFGDYIIRFDDEEKIKSLGCKSNTFTCKDNDLEPITNDIDKILPNGDRIIINGTTTIYIISKNINGVMKVFKGVARLKDGDIFDEKQGVNIARLKANKKRLEAELKGLEDSYIKQVTDKLDYLDKIKRQLEGYIGK